MDKAGLDPRLISAIGRVVKGRDAAGAGRIADRLRMRAGLTYRQVYDLINSVEPISLPDWETLMYEADEE